MTKTLKLPPAALKTISSLEAAGFEAFAVGGYVRDCLLGKAPTDIDIATSAVPEEVKCVFKGGKVIDTGLKHGTVTLISDGTPIEITTYRVDGGYSDGRRPDSVSFTKSLKEDMARRDFTINALACGREGGVIDFFGGINDIKRGIVRCVGKPEKRFEEDALRILRALRFASVLDFSIEENTKRAAIDGKELLKRISAERIREELLKLLCGKNAAEVLTEYIEILHAVLPELSDLPDITRAARTVESITPLPILRLAAVFHLLEAGKAARAIDRLRLDRKTRFSVLEIIRHGRDNFEENEVSIKNSFRNIGTELFFLTLRLKKASDGDVKSRDKYERIRILAVEIIKSGRCFSLETLAVDGKDVAAVLGCPPGKRVGEALEVLLSAVIEGKAPNTRDALLEYLIKEG